MPVSKQFALAAALLNTPTRSSLLPDSPVAALNLSIACSRTTAIKALLSLAVPRRFRTSTIRMLIIIWLLVTGIISALHP